MEDRNEPSEAQVKYVNSLRQDLKMSRPILDAHCVTRWRKPYERLDRSQVSELIDDLKAFKKAMPANLQRKAGQLDMPGL